jgi:LPS-assembly lipoprotein
MRRRALVLSSAASAGGALLAGCGFRLRGAMSFPFTSIHIAADGPVARDLKLALRSNGVTVLEASQPPDSAQVVLTLASEIRQRVVVGRSAAGQVRDLQLRILLKVLARNARGADLIAETELLQQRDISYSETAALSKEAEEQLLYRDMQADLVQQLMRRLASLKGI